jgi:hypothetical protein
MLYTLPVGVDSSGLLYQTGFQFNIKKDTFTGRRFPQREAEACHRFWTRAVVELPKVKPPGVSGGVALRGASLSVRRRHS